VVEPRNTIRTAVAVVGVVFVGVAFPRDVDETGVVLSPHATTAVRSARRIETVAIRIEVARQWTVARRSGERRLAGPPLVY